MSKITTDEFIEKAKLIHGEKYDYSKVEYINTHENVIIICNIHGEFTQKPKYHTGGKGCPICGKLNSENKRRPTNDEFIEKLKIKHNNKYDYSNLKYIDGKTNITIICPQHGEFIQKPKEHLSGLECPECIKIKNENRIKKNKEKFIEQSNLIHDNKYDYSMINFTKKNVEVTIICPIHGKFNQVPQNHTSGSGCPVCGKIKNGISNRDTKEDFINKANELHNNLYNYDEIDYTIKSEKIKIICPEHGEFSQTPQKHLFGQGCPKCRYIKSSNSNRYTTDEFIKLAEEVHGDKYTYEKSIYVQNKKNITITCRIHGDFHMIPMNFIYKKQGCPICGRIKCDESRTYTKEEFIFKANEKHNNKFDYSKVEYINTETKVIIICKKHGEFTQKPNNHVFGQGCPVCKSSRLERKMIHELNKNNIEYIFQYRVDWLKRMSLDFYIPSKNIGIECQGLQHFNPMGWPGGKSFEKIKESDDLKKQLCDQNNLKLIYYSELKIDYPYFVYQNLSEIIELLK